MRFLGGGVSLDELLRMPLFQRNTLIKAVELAEFQERRRMIHDFAAAFADPNKTIKIIDEEIEKIFIRTDKEDTLEGDYVGGVRWDADTDWQGKIRKYQK